MSTSNLQRTLDLVPAANQSNTPAPHKVQTVRLPVFRDGVFICNEFVPISAQLRTCIRAIAGEGRR
jgi:hypothetical protein